MGGIEPPAGWAHPRSRGENTSWLKRMVTCAGSSPLTRGKQWADEEYQLGIRLIPAHAGKTINN